MFEKRTESIERATRAAKGETAPVPPKRVTDRELFAATPGVSYQSITIPKAN